MTPGINAKPRVTNLRTQGLTRRSRNPSITIWPARVETTVEAWPESNKATANRTAAEEEPIAVDIKDGAVSRDTVV